MAADAKWNDWRWQMDRSRHCGEFAGESVRGEAFGFPVVTTPYYWSLVDAGDPDDPIRRMIAPSEDERRAGPSLTDDPIREEAHAVLPGLIRRYPDRALVLVNGECAVHCRHCTRRILGRGSVAPVRGEALDKALAYIAANPEIRDVILSGGDPMLLEDEELGEIVAKVRAISSVQIIRVHTRVPVALPMRVTPELARLLAARGPLYVNTQFNHPRELTKDALRAVSYLADAGIPVGNQSVLLAGLNDGKDVMEELLRGLLATRVRPYYLFACDLVAGTEHFRVPLVEAFALMEHLRGRLSGLGIPQLVVDLPGGLGKVPLGPSYLVSADAVSCVLKAPNGELVDYPDASLRGRVG
jgi:lysine 2,3-aminomutase